MKNIIMSITIIVNVHCLYGMQVVPSFTYGKSPQIVVIMDDIYNRVTQNADLTFVGVTEQEVLKNPDCWGGSPFIASIVLTQDNSVMKRNAIFTKYCDYTHPLESDTAAIVVEGETFIIKNLHSHVEHKKMDNRLLFIREPQVFVRHDKQLLDDKYIYKRSSVNLNLKDKWDEYCITDTFQGLQALGEALKDLSHCYETIFNYAHSLFSKEHHVKSIALPLLSISLGIPSYRAAHVAVASVLEFIKNNPNKEKYGLIEFVVQRLEDFNLYKDLLIQYGSDTK